MIQFRLKSAEEICDYVYSVCEVKECISKGEKLTSTETKFVDFCNEHYQEYIMGDV